MATRIAMDGERSQMVEECANCGAQVGFVLDDNDYEHYEFNCPECGEPMMFCTLCGDDYGHDECDWNEETGCKLCNKRIRKDCALYKDPDTKKLIREDWLKSEEKEKLKLWRPSKHALYCGKFTATISLTVGVDADDEDEAADLMEAFLGGTDKFYAECKTPPTNRTLPLFNLLHAMKLVGELDNIEFTVTRKPGMDDANTYNWKNQGEITIRRDN